MSSSDPAVRKVRDRIGAEIHRRIKSAVGPDADARIVSALEMTYFGALVNAGSGAFTYRQIADRQQYAEPKTTKQHHVLLFQNGIVSPIHLAKAAVSQQ